MVRVTHGMKQWAIDQMQELSSSFLAWVWMKHGTQKQEQKPIQENTEMWAKSQP